MTSCIDFEYSFLNQSNRRELQDCVDKLKALDWFKDENKIAMSTFSTYNSSNSWNEYFIVFYPTDSNTKVYNSEIRGVKNTKDNLYQYAYIKCVSRQYERLFDVFWYDKSDNENPNISFRVNNGYAYLSTSTLCPTGVDSFKPKFLDDYGKEIFVYLQCTLSFKSQCGIDAPSQPPTQPPVSSGGTHKEYQFIDKVETMKYLQGQDITISCEVDGDVELESGGVLFQYQLEGQDTYTDVKAEVTTSSTGKKRIWVRVKLP